MRLGFVLLFGVSVFGAFASPGTKAAGCVTHVKNFSDLAQLNAEIESGALNVTDLVQRQILVETDTKLYKLRDGQAMLDQPVPFRQILLPFAHTGVYLPKSIHLGHKLPKGHYKGFVILMPGIGTQISNAQNLFDIGSTLQKGKREPRLRVLPLLLDSTLGGMQFEAPAAWADHEHSVEVVRHVAAIASVLFPELRGQVWGRSQGGLIALEFAGSKHLETPRNISGVIAVNPPYPTQHMVEESIRLTEKCFNGDGAFDKGVILSFNHSWKVYREVTPHFHCLRRTSKVPALLLLGSEDGGYPQPDHLEVWKTFASHSDLRQTKVYQAGHNLWSRESGMEEIFTDVLSTSASFFEQSDARLTQILSAK